MKNLKCPIVRDSRKSMSCKHNSDDKMLHGYLKCISASSNPQFFHFLHSLSVNFTDRLKYKYLPSTTMKSIRSKSQYKR